MPTIKTNSAICAGLAGGLFLFAPFALAQDDDTIVTTAPPAAEAIEAAAPLPEALENGLMVSDASGAETRITFSADGYYEDGDGSAGGWTMEDGFLCMAASTGNVNCTAVPEDAAAGTSWSTTKADGSTISFAIPAADSGNTEMPDGEGDAG